MPPPLSSPVAPVPLGDEALNAILALQFTMAWAGEGRCRPARLGWWETDLIDEDGGGDFLARLLPQTHAWAALEATREAARRADLRARMKMGDADSLRTLFFLGFEVDEQLADHLVSLKHQLKKPAETLPLPLPLGAEFSREALEKALGAGDIPFSVVPGGRLLDDPIPKEPETVVRRLACALVPFAEQYPLPFYRVPK